MMLGGVFHYFGKLRGQFGTRTVLTSGVHKGSLFARSHGEDDSNHLAHDVSLALYQTNQKPLSTAP